MEILRFPGLFRFYIPDPDFLNLDRKINRLLDSNSVGLVVRLTGAKNSTVQDVNLQKLNSYNEVKILHASLFSEQPTLFINMLPS